MSYDALISDACEKHYVDIDFSCFIRNKSPLINDSSTSPQPESFPAPGLDVPQATASPNAALPVPVQNNCFSQNQLTRFKVATAMFQASKAATNASRAARLEEEAQNRIDDTSLIVSLDGKLHMLTKHGLYKTILSEAPQISRIIASYSSEYIYYILDFPASGEQCVIDAANLTRRGKLEEALNTHAPSVHLFTYGASRPVVLDALVRYIRVCAEEYHYAYYHGWVWEENRLCFRLLRDTTHGVPLPKTSKDLEDPKYLEQVSPSATIAAAQAFSEAFGYFTDAAVRKLLFIWYHISFMFTLLSLQGYAPPLGLCLDSDDKSVHHVLEALLSWYGDSPISLAEDPEMFLDHLRQYKDQPLLIRCRSAGAHNRHILQNVIAETSIPKSQKFSSPTRLRAPIVLLSHGASFPAYDPAWITVALDSVDKRVTPRIRNLRQHWKSYFGGFASFIIDNEALLVQLLEDGRYAEEADFQEPGDLSFECADFLSLYHSMSKIIMTFFRSLDPDFNLLQNAGDILMADDELVIRLLQRCNSVDNYDCQRFLMTAQQLLETGTVSILPAVSPDAPSVYRRDSPAAVLYDGTYCYLNNAFFNQVVKRCQIPIRDLSRTLKDTNILKGPFINLSAYQAQLPYRYLAKGDNNIHMYKIEQRLLDEDRSSKSFFRR